MKAIIELKVESYVSSFVVKYTKETFAAYVGI